MVHPFQQVIAHAKRVGHDRQRRIYCAARAKEARINNVEIVELVCFAVSIQRAGLRIVAETHSSVLMGYTGERDPLTQIQIAGKNTFVTLMPVDGTSRVADSSDG